MRFYEINLNVNSLGEDPETGAYIISKSDYEEIKTKIQKAVAPVSIKYSGDIDYSYLSDRPWYPMYAYTFNDVQYDYALLGFSETEENIYVTTYIAITKEGDKYLLIAGEF